jgi:hypothetical protein
VYTLARGSYITYVGYLEVIIVGLDARTKGPSPLVGESDMSPESELSPKYISGAINLYAHIPKKNRILDINFGQNS